jgi:hypothetical protein
VSDVSICEVDNDGFNEKREYKPLLELAVEECGHGLFGHFRGRSFLKHVTMENLAFNTTSLYLKELWTEHPFRIGSWRRPLRLTVVRSGT